MTSTLQLHTGCSCPDHLWSLSLQIHCWLLVLGLDLRNVQKSWLLLPFPNTLCFPALSYPRQLSGCFFAMSFSSFTNSTCPLNVGFPQDPVLEPPPFISR